MPCGCRAEGNSLTNLLMLIPVALTLGLIGLLAFLWALKSGQFDDLDGAANRILFDDDDARAAQAAAANKPPLPAVDGQG